MKLLYSNLIEDATLSATNEDTSYPISSVIARFLEDKFQATGTSSVITIEFNMDQDVSCIALGFTNATTATYELFNSSSVSLLTGSLEVAYDTNMTYFTETTCRRIEITISASTTLYLGGLSCGSPLDIPYINVNPRIDFYTRDKGTLFKGGQFTSDRTAPLLRYRATLGSISQTLLGEIFAMINTVGNRTSFYGDLYEDSHDVARPIYCKSSGNGQFNRDSQSGDYSTTIVLEETR